MQCDNTQGLEKYRRYLHKHMRKDDGILGDFCFFFSITYFKRAGNVLVVTACSPLLF